MRSSYCERNCSPIFCLRSQFCCYLPSFLRTKDAPNISSAPNVTTNPNSNSISKAPIDELPTEQKLGALDVNNEKSEILNLRSSLKPTNGNRSDLNEEKKGNVQWMDLIGKELTEIREFEPSESGDSIDGDSNPPCVCVIQ
ncbi:hypothetical protein LUZ60_010243 [Juncus effusus]|nr:hypothetical protein LUZ60_010243 [Juncus effusus]